MDGCIDGWMDGELMDGYMDGSMMDGREDGWEGG
jgi:hypothetical protein